jgi:iron complex outermembrane receptor protein
MIGLSLCAMFASPGWAQSPLPEVVVTATRFAESAASLPFGVSVITADDIRASGAGTVNEAVMKLLGVVGRLDTSGGNNYDLDLRGFGSTSGSNQVIIVDGLRLNEADLTNAGLASIPIATVHRIEVLHGTGAVLYGEGATGGVIIITTKAGTGADRKNAANVFAAAGSLGLRETRATATLASGGFSVDVAASDRNSDGHRINFASASDAVSGSAQWSNDWLRVGVRGSRDASRSGSPDALTAAQYAADPRQANSLVNYNAAQKSSSGMFAEAFVGAWRLVADTHQRSKDYDSLALGSPYAYTVDASNSSLRARHEGALAQLPNVFVVGHDSGRWERTLVTSPFTPVGTQARARTSAWYVKDDLSFPATGTRVLLGYRDEALVKSEASSLTTLNQRQQAWELGLSQALGAGVTAFARIGSSFRLANVDEFSFTNPGVPLQAQTSRDTELGARWRGAGSALEVRWYRSALRNEIGYDPAGNGPFGPFGANVNFDPTQRHGLELDASQAVTPVLDLRLNAAFRRARFTAGPYAGNDVMLVPKRTLALRADWRPAPGHTLGGGIVWVSSQSPDFANQCRIPGYATADLRYAYTWRNAELALGIGNLTDRKYYTQAFGCTAAGVTTAIYPEAGRTMTASVSVQF